MRLAIIILFALTGWWVMTHSVAGDISLSLHEAKMLLAGGQYGEDFFEVNPPLYLYLYMPAIILSNFFSLNLFVAFQLYLLTLIAGSLFLCQRFIRNDNKLLVILAFIILILPTPIAFGQREHLLLIFTLPYLFLLAKRLENGNVKPLFAILIGIFAGIGFAIKPFFCLSFILLEMYYLFQKRKWFAWLRPEVMAVGVVILAYLLFVFAYHQAYLKVVMPLALRLYYQGFAQEWLNVLCMPGFVSVIICAILYFVTRKYDSHKKITNLFFICMVGFAIAYLMQRLNWYYHIYPAFGLALLLTLYFSRLLIRKKVVNAYVLCLLVLIMPLTQAIFCLQEISFWQEKEAALNTFIKKHAYQQPIYFLTTSLKVEYPVVDYAGALPSSKFPSLWWLSGYLKQNHCEQLENDKNYFINTIASELITHKPVLVFVQIEKNFNLVAFFSQNKNFANEWKNYRYLMDIEEKDYYHLSVYKRQ